MFIYRHYRSRSLVLILFLVVSSTALGQQENSALSLRSSPVVTAASSGDAVRFSAPGNITGMRVEIYAATGEEVFDSGKQEGNVLDWRWPDAKAPALSAGSFLCVVTVQSLSGKTSRKLASVSVDNQQVTLQPVEAAQLNPAQTQALGSTETDTPLTIIGADQTIAATVIAHNGNDGQINRTRGALTFRVGDFFRGTDTEQVRLTEAGDLGLGTSQPRAKLDVAGTIRAERVLIAKPANSTKRTDGAQASSSTDSAQPLASGTGTQGRIAKWLDNSGTLGDSVAIDTGNGLQLTVAPNGGVDTNLLYLDSTNGTTGVLAGNIPSYGAANGPFFAMRGNTYTTIANQRGLFTIAAGNVSSPLGDDGSVKFNTGNDQLRMVIRPGGNVGIGTTNPQSLLDVAGNINTSTQYNIGGSRALAVTATNNIFAGSGAGAVNTGIDNSFFGFNAGNANTTGNDNAFFGDIAGRLNTTGGANAFFGTSAGTANTTGSTDSFFGRSAGEKNGTGSDNSFFGALAGFSNTSGLRNSVFGSFAAGNFMVTSTASDNSFFGYGTAFNNTGGSNAFFGSSAGNANTSGSNNSFFGFGAGASNTTENSNTFIGASSNGMAGITNATAIGAKASVTQSNSLVLGSINGINGANADTNVGIGTRTPEQRLSVNGAMNIDQGNQNNGTTDFALSFGHASGEAIASRRTVGVNQFGLDFYTQFAARMSITQSGNVGVGTNNPSARLDVRDGSGGSLSGAHVQIGAPVANADEKIIGFGDSTFVCLGPCVSIGEADADNRMVLRADSFRVKGGSFSPYTDNFNKLGESSNRWSEVWAVNGVIQTSDARLKQRIVNLRYGLSQVMQLRPVTFQWKDGSDRRTHLGLIAQEVERVMPEMIERGTDTSQPLGMNYDNLIPVLIKAVQQQQGALERSQAEIKNLRAENEALNKRIATLQRSRRRTR